jgi:hypothetical protein
MRRKLLHGILTGCMATVGVLVAGADAQTQDARPDAKAPAVDPKTIWPVGLESLAGRDVFVQVATPGGLWERDGKGGVRQTALPDCPQELQNLLTKAEIVVSDLAKPTEVSADERTSPSGRGKLRFYHEEGTGKLILKNLPGIGGSQGDKGQYSGSASFSVDHQSHSNPSISGVLEARKRQEPTWGVACLDYADFHVYLPEVPGKDNGEAPPIIGNARILRSGIEIFAYMEWEGKSARGPRTYQGCVRLAKTGAQAPPAKPQRDVASRTALRR